MTYLVLLALCWLVIPVAATVAWIIRKDMCKGDLTRR